eukprot:TRINITY_DN9791_c0_g1_i2.p1 TRINITY_DN9791_c0_g1~~TRINITY_DN9791_c0_g1_i2.p1  ORF type:complete len:244 (+),score=42.95 TRINITY_DN9791_c0_g1_i2:91-732(+)
MAYFQTVNTFNTLLKQEEASQNNHKVIQQEEEFLASQQHQVDLEELERQLFGGQITRISNWADEEEECDEVHPVLYQQQQINNTKVQYGNSFDSGSSDGASLNVSPRRCASLRKQIVTNQYLNEVDNLTHRMSFGSSLSTSTDGGQNSSEASDGEWIQVKTKARKVKQDTQKKYISQQKQIQRKSVDGEGKGKQRRKPRAERMSRGPASYQYK